MVIFFYDVFFFFWLRYCGREDKEEGREREGKFEGFKC